MDSRFSLSGNLCLKRTPIEGESESIVTAAESLAQVRAHRRKVPGVALRDVGIVRQYDEACRGLLPVHDMLKILRHIPVSRSSAVHRTRAIELCELGYEPDMLQRSLELFG